MAARARFPILLPPSDSSCNQTTHKFRRRKADLTPMPHATIPPRLRDASILPALRVQTPPPLPKPPSTIPCSLPRWPLAFPLRASPLFHYAFAGRSGGRRVG